MNRNDHPQRESNYVQYERESITEALDFPTSLSQIPDFEKRNNISVNVFGLESNGVYHLEITKHRGMLRHVNLLLFSKGEARHYCLIKNLNNCLVIEHHTEDNPTTVTIVCIDFHLRISCKNIVYILLPTVHRNWAFPRRKSNNRCILITFTNNQTFLLSYMLIWKALSSL